ncbi:MAG TPA: ABC transporter substrate-binding protein [Gemmatimonadota bacterium]|nr:ABC transporter substrate-binding protein [Gemmatimonadota bacterium]
MKRRHSLVALLALLLGTSLFAQSASSTRGQEGGILLVHFSPASGLDHIDPALSFTQAGWALLDTTCARLMTYPDKPAPASYRLEREVAATYRIAPDFRTYTFTLRRGFRFSNGAPVRANAFEHAINRALQPFINAPGAIYMQDIVGASDVLEGQSKKVSGVVARGNTLVIRFTRPAPDFLARTAMPFFCAVPPNLPSSGEGVGPFHTAGPYYFTEYRENERVTIRRNPYYGGSRKIHLDGFDVTQSGTPTDMIRRIDTNEADWGHTISGVFMDPSLGLLARHRINAGRLLVRPGLSLRMLAFNASRPLFRNNPGLRRAVNFALDREALLATAGGSIASKVTDQYLPYGIPGFENADIYPLDKPNLARARALADGNLRSRKAVMYTTDFTLPVAAAQLVARQLDAIGLQVEVRRIPLHIATAAYLEKLAARGEGWDIALVLWTPNIPDAHAYLNQLLETQIIDDQTLTRFRSGTTSRELRRAARTLQARERSRAYARLDALLVEEYAPLAALNVINEVTFTSDRVGCRVLRPVLDLAVACLQD